MIICNAINFIVFRTPSMILGFYGYNYRYDSLKNEHLPDLFSYNICRCSIFTLFDLFFSSIFNFLYFGYKF